MTRLTALLFVVCALHLAPAATHAAIVTYDIGTVNFGGGIPPGGPIGSGSATGSFDFDDVALDVVSASFTATGVTPAALDGVYDTVDAFDGGGLLSVFRSSDGADPQGKLTIDLTLLLLFGGSPPIDLSFGSVNIIECLPGSIGGPGGLGSGPCDLAVLRNSSSGGVAQQTTGIGSIPLPPTALMLGAAVAALGAGGLVRRR